MDIYNDALINQCEYAKEADIKRILLNFTTFAQLSMSGNMSAYTVLLDVQAALNKLESKKQRHCIIRCLVKGWTQLDVAQEMDIRKDTVNVHIKKGIRNISKYLTGGGSHE